MRISIRNGLVPSEILDVDAWGSDTVESVKSQVCQALGLDSSAAFLAYQGYALSDDMKLDDIPIPEGAELLIMVTGVVG